MLPGISTTLMVMAALGITQFLRIDCATSNKPMLKAMLWYGKILGYGFVLISIFAVFFIRSDVEYLVFGLKTQAVVTKDSQGESGNCLNYTYGFSLADGGAFEGTAYYPPRSRGCSHPEGEKITIEYLKNDPASNRPQAASPLRIGILLFAVFLFYFARRYKQQAQGLLDNGTEVDATDITYRKAFGTVYEVTYNYRFEDKSYRAKTWLEDKTYSEQALPQLRKTLLDAKRPARSILLLS